MLTEQLLKQAFTAMVRHGALKMVTSRGTVFRFGDGGAPQVAIRFADAGAEWALCLDPELKLGQLYTDERLLIEHGSLFDFLTLVLQADHGELNTAPLASLRRVFAFARRVSRTNDAVRSKHNAAHHYDLDARLYGLFLDRDRQYSCAYFEHPDQPLDDAQAAKKRHIAKKLRLRPGHRVLDIGSGWGGLALYLAEVGAAGDVLGVTLSEEQFAYATERAAKAGLADRVRFALQDYRAVEGTFDRIVTVGMFEHVGSRSYDAFFKTCRRLLADDGMMLLHTIARTGRPYPTNPWITRHIFPGGHIPTLSEIAPALERSGLMLTDLEVLRCHYAYTLKAWRERFVGRWNEAAQIYGERFCRMWECYLAMSEAAFRFEDAVVFQIQLAPWGSSSPTETRSPDNPPRPSQNAGGSAR